MAQVVSYLPSFYFGSLLLLFGVEILSDWLLKSWKKVTRKEYGLLLATFAAVMIGALCLHPAWGRIQEWQLAAQSLAMTLV